MHPSYTPWLAPADACLRTAIVSSLVQVRFDRSRGVQSQQGNLLNCPLAQALCLGETQREHIVQLHGSGAAVAFSTVVSCFG